MSSSRGGVSRGPRRPLSRIAVVGLMLALLAALGTLLPGPVYRSGGWFLETAFAVLRWAVYAGIAAVVVSLVGAVLARPGGRHRGFLYAVGGLLTGLVAVGIPLAYVRTAQGVPPIHKTSSSCRALPILPSI